MKRLLLTLLILLAITDTALSAGKKSISIELMASSQAEVDALSATAFGVSLARALSKEGNITLEPIGVYKPTYKILIAAFTSQIQIWRELKEGSRPESQYMNQLISVDDDGFLEEYVGVHHSAAISGDIPINLRVVEFKNWSEINLRNHTPRIEARLNLSE